MPFISQDWRGTDEQWVKTPEGWERLKLWRLRVLENLSDNYISRLCRTHRLSSGSDGSVSDDSADVPLRQPFIHMPKRPSREAAAAVSASEAFHRLDIVESARNPRRFHYVCALLQRIIRHKLHLVGGTAQRLLYQTLKAVLQQVLKTGNQTRVVHLLLADLALALHRYRYDHVGSDQRWEQNVIIVEQMQLQLADLRLLQRPVHQDSLTLIDLPDDCIRHILLRLSDHMDLANTGQLHRGWFALTQENLIWRRLCFYHFSPQQINQQVGGGWSLDEQNWQTTYFKLFRRFGHREVYSDMLRVCLNCDCVFWQSCGHPCLADSEAVPKSRALSPQQFIDMVLP